MARSILSPGRNCQGIYRSSWTGLLIDGRNYFRAFYEAARRARRYILMTGWQFERSAPLLRGRDREGAPDPVRLDRFLNSLCERNPDLEIFILMWDFNPIVAFDKEWFNKLILDLVANDRIRFRFDGRHALYASHHQKLVVIDGVLAFVGGLDIAANSWDDRMHWADNAGRVLSGEQFEPYHDVQSLCTGPVAWELAKLFQTRWTHAGGGNLDLAPPGRMDAVPVPKLLPVKASKTAISVTRGRTLVPLVEPVMHIRQLYLDAIAAAERLIYIETQYFSSQAIYEALKERITRGGACPQIVLILPKRLHTLIEDISLSVVQAKMLRALTELAARHNRSLGIYFTAAALKALGPEKATYIHSKVMIVDDRFLSVGSANLTNRSMGMDTELNLSWEAGSGDGDALARSIRRARANLLAEHTGLRRLSQRRALGTVDGLVDYLNNNADRLGCRLRRHTMESFLEDLSWIKDLMPEDLSIDPERPIIEESIIEFISRDRNSIFAKGILLLNELTLAQPPERLEGQKVLKLEIPERIQTTQLGSRGQYRWYVMAAVGIAVAAAIWLLLDR